MSILQLFCSALVISSTLGAFTEYRKEILDQDGNYLIEWSLDYEAKLVEFTASVKTEGYVGFGISPTGGMKAADIVIGGVSSNGSTYFSDRHGINNSLPVVDANQNWELNSGSFNGTHTILKFSRLFDTCDDEDLPLTSDTTHFIWAYGQNANDEITYHETRKGTLTVQPLDPESPPVDLSTFQKYTITHKMVMPANDTTYWCTIHKSPQFKSKHHIVAFEPKLESPEAIAHAHHYNIFRCTAPEGVTPEEYFEPYIGKDGGECYVPNPEVPAPHCQTMFYNWAVGGKMLILPENIGYPIGETGSPVDYYMFEIHYNNPTELSGVEFETGATIYYTNETREHDAGLMVVAHHTSIALTVPPKSKAYKTVGHCDPQCTSKYLPKDGINVFAIFLHAHLSGRQMKFRQFRENRELPWAANDDTYDFEFQQTRLLSRELKVLPGDQLTMECIYDTTWREGTTVGGLSTREEMCQSIFWYYPRAELTDCRSEYPVDKLFELFGIESAIRNTPYEDAIITEPEKFRGKRYTEVLDNFTEWTPELREYLQQYSVSQPHIGVCYTSSNLNTGYIMTGYPKNLVNYVPENQCESGTGSCNIRCAHFVLMMFLVSSVFIPK